MKKFSILLLFYTGVVFASNSLVDIEQVGNNNIVTISQQGPGHSTVVRLGETSDVDNATVDITQQGTGAKSATVELKSGVNHSVTIFQDGLGSHSTSILNLTGTTNSFNITQTGADSHSFTVTGDTGTTNSGNTVTATQSGAGIKQFDLVLQGTSGATVTVEQTANTANTGSMAIQCNPCGAYNYTRN